MGAGLGMRAAKGYQGAFCVDGAVLYLDCSGDCVTVCLSKLTT